MLLGMEAIDDLDSVGEILVGHVPNPGSPITENGLPTGPVEAAPRRFTLDPRRKRALAARRHPVAPRSRSPLST